VGSTRVWTVRGEAPRRIIRIEWFVLWSALEYKVALLTEGRRETLRVGGTVRYRIGTESTAGVRGCIGPQDGS
jgi:hypothetical protein